MDLKRQLNMNEKVNLNGVSIGLGLHGMPDPGTLNEILYNAKHRGLPIYFDDIIYGTKVSSSFDEIIDENNGIKAVMVHGDTFLCEGRKTLVAEDSCRDELNLITVAQFIYKGEAYCPVDETGTWLEFIKFDLSHFYCLREELDAFIKNVLDKPSTKDTIKSKKLTKQKQREKVFKIWLATKANITMTNESQYQECYEKIGEHTQAEIWDMLQKIDNKLFRTGKDDFFKKQEIIILKIGTGKGR